MPTDTPPAPALAVAAAERAVEEAWDSTSDSQFVNSSEVEQDRFYMRLAKSVRALLAARRAALSAGLVECWVSREAVDLWRRWRAGEPLSGSALSALDHDLAALLMEPAK